MSEVKHTPWWIDYNRPGELDSAFLMAPEGTSGREDGSGYMVFAEVFDVAQQDVQAALGTLLQAVNSHGDLVEALREMVKWHCVRGKDNLPLPIEEQEEEVQQAMRALSKVLELGEGL